MEATLFKKMPKMTLDIRISVDSCQTQRYTEDEINQLIKDEKVLIKSTSQGSPLLIRKSDGAVLGEILFKK